MIKNLFQFAKYFIIVSVLFLSYACGGSGGGGKAPYSDPNPLSSDTTPPDIKSVTAISEKSVLVEFTESIEEVSAIQNENYQVSSTDTILLNDNIEFQADNQSVKLNLQTSMEHNVEYTCFVKDVADTEENKITGASRTFIGRGLVTATLATLPQAITNADNFEITVSGIDIISYKYKLDTGEWSSEIDVSDKILQTGLSEGNHTIYAIGKDSLGNWQPDNRATSYTWEIDTTAPIARLTNLPANITASNAIDITVNDVTAYKYKINSEAWSGELQGNIARTELADGEYVISVIGKDLAGNWKAESDATTYSWKINTANPVAILSGTPAVLGNQTALNALVSGASVVAYKYKLDGSAWSAERTILQAISSSSLGEGNHTLEVIAKSESGIWQAELEATTYAWQIDTTPPVISINQKPTSPSSELRPIINVAGAGVVSYKYKIDSQDWSSLIAATDNIPFSDLSEGNHTISVIGQDQAGNLQAIASAAQYSWTVDLTAPVALFVHTSLPVAMTNSQNENIGILSSDLVAYRYKLDSGAWSNEISIATNTISLDNTMLTEGTHVIQVIGKDAAGNWQSINNITTFGWEIDITPPEISLSNLPADPTAANSVNIGVTNLSDAVSYQYSLNGVDWVDSAILDPIGLSSLTEGRHTLQVRGIDAAGNVQATALSHSWVVDQTAQVAVLNNLPALLTNNQTANIGVSGTDVVSYKYSLDDGSWSAETAVATGINLSGLTEGARKISVISKDSAGNWQDTSSATNYNWTIDITPTTAELQNTPAAATNNGTLNADVTGTDVVAYKYSINGSAWSTEIAQATKIVETLAAGDYTLSVIAKDSAGNWQDSGAATNYSWTVDQTAPAAPTVSDEGEFATASDLTFSWTNDVDVADVKIQIATDAAFSNIVFGGADGASLGNVNTYAYAAGAAGATNFYARVKTADAVNNWSSFGTATDGITLVGAVSINIKNNSNQDVSGAVVTLKLSADGSTVTTGTSAANGDVQFDNLEIGANAYYLEVAATGYVNATKNNISVNIGQVSNQGVLYLVNTGASAGRFNGNVIDSNDGSNISGAIVQIKNWAGTIVNTKTSGADGTFSSDILDPGTYTIQVTKDNYFGLTIDNQTLDGDTNLGRPAICEILPPYQLRVVVQWGDSPQDLDLHVVGPTADTANRFHVYWSKKSYDENTFNYVNTADPTGSFSTASLVQDATRGYGPEAINLFKYGSGYAYGVYTFTVHNYSTRDWYGSPITVRVFDSEGLLQEIPIPTGAPNEWYWKVFKIDVQGPNRGDKTITIANEFATLDYRSTSSMDWSISGGGMAAYLISFARGNMTLIGIAFMILIAIFIGLVIINKKRMINIKH
jgi:hypothetical protein